MRRYKHDWGKLLFLRVLLAGWALQAIHTLDRTERSLRLSLEILAIALTVSVMFTVSGSLSGWLILCSAVPIHTVLWVCDSGWLTGMRDCVGCVRNRGVHRTIDYLDFTKRIIAESATANAVLVYGSLSRRTFHERSDLDLRILRRRGIGAAIRLFFLCIVLRICGMYKYGVILDLKMVDTAEFLGREMRSDERPIVIFCAPGFAVPTAGEAYETLKREPQAFLRRQQNANP